MAIRTYKINLDSKNTIAPEPIFLRQGDKTGAVIIDASITDNGSAFNLAGLTPVFKANTADNKAVIIDSKGFSIVDASNGKFTYKVPGALSTAPGKIRTAYFGFTDSSGVESTFNLTFVVQAAPDVGTVKSENYITLVNGTYADITELTDAYPQGNPGIFLTTNDLNWCYWDDKKGAWIAGGPFNAYPSTNLIKNGDFLHGDMSSLDHNDGVSLAPQNFDSMDWAHVIGNINQGNTDVYFNVPVSGDNVWVQWAQLKFDCDINSPKISNLRVFIDVNFTAGSSRTVLINQFTLQPNQHNRISVLTPVISSLNPDNKTIASINIGIASLDDAVDYSVAKVRIAQYQQPVNGEDLVKNYETNQKDNLVTDSQLIANTPILNATNGTVSLVQINGRNWNQITTADKTKNPEAYYSIDKRALTYPLTNFINRKWLFKGTLLCNTDSDYMLYCDAFDQTGVMHRITIGSVHVYANKEKSFAVETPTMAESGIFSGTDVTIVNFTITGLDPNVVMNATDIFIKPFAPKQKKTTLDYFEKDAIAKYGTSLVGHDGSVRTEIHQFSNLNWIYSSPTPPSNNETYLRVPKPNNVHALDGYYYGSIRLGLSIVSEATQNITLRLDIVDNTGKITSKDLGVYYVIVNQRNDIKVDTPRIAEVYMSDPANITEIRFVFSPENKTANYNTGNYSIILSPKNAPQTDSMFLPNYIPYSLGKWFNVGTGITKTDILENNVRKLSIKGVSGQTNTDLYVTPTMFPEYQVKRWQEHLVFEPDIDCTVTTQFDLFNGNVFVKTIVLGSHKVLAGQKVLLNDVSPKLSDVVSSPYNVLNFNIKTDMTSDKLSYKISEFYIKEYIPETLSSPSQSTSGASKLPELRLYGQVPQSATDKTTMSFKFVSGSLTNLGYTTLAWQGQSSKSLAKKSYKLKTYTTSDLSKKLKMQIDPTFASASAFTLKACYSDKTFSLDNIANEVIHDMVISRPIVSEHLSKSDYFGQCKGRAVLLYVNDIFAGLYFMRSGSKDDMYFMDETDPNQFVVEGETEHGAAMFQAPHVTVWDDGSGSTNIEFGANVPDTLTDAQKKAFDNFVNMVYTGDLPTFKSSLTPEALHSAIDYIIFYNLFGNVDSCGRNLEWATWDGGKHFMVVPYDFDQTMFNAWDGLTVADASADGFPVKQMRFGTTTNKYFDLIAQAYPDEIKTRYAELRTGLLREDNVLSRYTNFMKQIDIENYTKELELWPRKTVIDYKYISNFINTRFKLVDTQFAAFIAPLLGRK
ncbi:CotH kinase family protein [Lacticaseibacillus paracasei]|uniref:CotH kinase family protein n=1 Tax=Lacticaseibacillus paracasei TaxID=1597 RepID=UPI0031DF8B2E